MIGDVIEETWTLIATEVDGVLQPELIGERRRTRRAYFAYRAEAADWRDEQLGLGYGDDGAIVPCATFRYHGPTDSPSNCWAVEVADLTHG